MSFAKVYSAQHNFLEVNRIDIEVDISKGLHSFSVVGLGDKAVDESKDRVSAAIKNSGFKPPKSRNEKITISLAPAHLRKIGPLFDVSIALCYLKATEDIKFDENKKMFLGELSLDGKIRKVSGILPLVKFAKDNNFEEVFVPYENREEAGLIENIKIYGAKNLREVIDHINEIENDPDDSVENLPNKIQPQTKTKVKNIFSDEFDISNIKEQEHAKRALKIAIAGGHNIALFGPPGTGKTMLAKASREIMPQMTFDECLEITSIHSVAGILKGPIITKPPFRSPHHTASYVSIIGGGNSPKPGEITLAHNGILFLDEFPEFDKRVIESLRQPLEEKEITISRSWGNMTFPANFILITALNPCPCGYFNSSIKNCTCLPQHILNYQKKLSGPIIDRIDIWIEVSEFDHKKILERESNKNLNQKYRDEILEIRKIQKKRYGSNKLNGGVGNKEVLKLFNIDEKAKDILNKSAKKMALSPRAYHKVLKVSRTIADLEKIKNVNENHVLEALQYRKKN